MTVSRLSASVTTWPEARPPSTSFCGLAMSADKKMSAGAPWSIFASSAADESVEMLSVMPGLAGSYAALTSASTALSEAAAYTWSCAGPPDAGVTGGPAVGAGAGLTLPVGAASGRVELHAAKARAAASRVPMARIAASCRPGSRR